MREFSRETVPSKRLEVAGGASRRLYAMDRLWQSRINMSMKNRSVYEMFSFLQSKIFSDRHHTLMKERFFAEA
jgi:hypothetical protein